MFYNRIAEVLLSWSLQNVSAKSLALKITDCQVRYISRALRHQAISQIVFQFSCNVTYQLYNTSAVGTKNGEFKVYDLVARSTTIRNPTFLS